MSDDSDDSGEQREPITRYEIAPWFLNNPSVSRSRRSNHPRNDLCICKQKSIVFLAALEKDERTVPRPAVNGGSLQRVAVLQRPAARQQLEELSVCR